MADKLKGMSTPEHKKVFSRTRGVMLEVGVGPHGTSTKDGDVGGLVPKNPFVSQAQEGWAHMHPEKFGKANLAHWDAATKGKHLPKRVKKSK